eukprot:5270237-Prymnesium_polylepis.1
MPRRCVASALDDGGRRRETWLADRTLGGERNDFSGLRTRGRHQVRSKFASHLDNTEEHGGSPPSPRRLYP